jgi:hypothetical protein
MFAPHTSLPRRMSSNYSPRNRSLPPRPPRHCRCCLPSYGVYLTWSAPSCAAPTALHLRQRPLQRCVRCKWWAWFGRHRARGSNGTRQCGPPAGQGAGVRVGLVEGAGAGVGWRGVEVGVGWRVCAAGATHTHLCNALLCTHSCPSASACNFQHHTPVSAAPRLPQPRSPQGPLRPPSHQARCWRACWQRRCPQPRAAQRLRRWPCWMRGRHAPTTMPRSSAAASASQTCEWLMATSASHPVCRRGLCTYLPCMPPRAPPLTCNPPHQQ